MKRWFAARLGVMVVSLGLVVCVGIGCEKELPRGAPEEEATPTVATGGGSYYEPFPGPTTEYAQAGSEAAEGAGQQLE
jgi:hypothetical protein